MKQDTKAGHKSKAERQNRKAKLYRYKTGKENKTKQNNSL